MWRVRCTSIVGAAESTVAVRLQWVVQSRRGMAFRPISPYGLTIPVAAGSMQGGASSGASWMGTATRSCHLLSMHESKRFFRAKGHTSGGDTSATEERSANGSEAAGSTANAEPSEGGAEKSTNTAEGKQEDKKAGGAPNQEEEGPKGIRGTIEAFKRDYVEFPDIYNSANAINFVLFTVFCLCSTGSNVEADWWINQFGIDAAFRPLAWFMHSIVMNNFLSMTFAMMLLHSMCHSVLLTVGSRGLFQYCAIISLTCGVAMWAFNYAIGYTKEKQFGPWDIVAGLFVMQYMHQGFTPWGILNSFNGWVRYACWVGAVCILYYDPQPTVLGAGVGLALCKLHPRFRVSGAASAAA